MNEDELIEFISPIQSAGHAKGLHARPLGCEWDIDQK